MGTLVMPAGNLGVGAPCEDVTCGKTLQGQTARKPRQRFADLPALAKTEEKAKSNSASEKVPDFSESFGETASNPQPKRMSSAVPKGNQPETVAIEPALPAVVSAQSVGEYSAEKMFVTGTPGQTPLPEVANAGGGAGTAQASNLQNLPAGTLLSGSAGAVSESQTLPPASVTTSGDAGSIAGPRPLTSEPTANGDTNPPPSEVAEIVPDRAKPSGNMDKTDNSASQTLPEDGADPGQAVRSKSANSEIPAAFIRRAPDPAATVEPRAAHPDPAGVLSAPAKNQTRVSDQAVGAGAKEAAEVSPWTATRAMKMPEQNGGESRPGGHQDAAPQPQAGLFLEKKDPVPFSAKDPFPAVPQGELHARSEFVMPVGESPSPASQRATFDPATLDGPSLRTPVQNVGEQILDSMRASIVPGDKQLVVRLQPPELGTVLVRFREQSGEIQAVMEVHRSDTRREIEQAVPQVLRGLQDAGVLIRRLDVVPHDQLGADAGRGLFQQDGAPSQQQNQGHHFGQMHDRFQPSWGTYRDSGRQNTLNVTQNGAGGNSQEWTGQGRIDVLL